MNKRNLTIIGIVLIVTVLAGGVFWYGKNQAKKNNIEIKNEKQTMQMNKQNNEQITTDKIKKIENELWNQLMRDPKETSRDKNNFSISKVNDNKTIALGAYTSNGPGGANVFAYRLNLDEEWIVKITQEALLCSDVVKFSEDQIKFVKKNYVNYCAEFDKDGFMHKKDL